jgi:ribosomal protein S18 acetylase RimI-like enzyme
VTRAIRTASPDDHAAIIALTLRAWEPVYPEVNAVLGPELAELLHGTDWREHQEREVREALESPSMTFWVAETDGAVTGFVAARVVDPRRAIGEVYIVGVDPSAQRTGVGAALTEHATGWLRDQGMRVAYISTGGDPAHAPARALYERLGYRALPGVQYFKAL